MRALIFIVLFAFILVFLNLPLISIAGIAIFLHQLYNLFSRVGHTFPVRELTGVVASLQWIVASILSYHFNPKSQFYYMAIDESVYMSYIVPATLAYIVGLNLGRKSTLNNEEQAIGFLSKDSKNLMSFGSMIFWIGIFAQLLRDLSPGALGYFFLLLSNLSIIGAFYLFSAEARFKWLYLIASVFFQLRDAAEHGVFHDLLIWLCYIFFFISFKNRFSTKVKLAFLVIGLFFIAVIQGIKYDYRVLIRQEKLSAIEKIALISDMTFDRLTNLDFLSDSKFGDNNIDRFNQGWIISRIMAHVPVKEPFANGETIVNGLEAAFVPRVLNPNKLILGGRDNMLRFAGMRLDKGISMDLGLVGEAYANFSVVGGVIFMFLIGVFFNFLISIVINQREKVPSLILWIPFLFFYMIKAETDFATVLNQMIKSMMVLLMIIVLFRRKILSR